MNQTQTGSNTVVTVALAAIVGVLLAAALLSIGTGKAPAPSNLIVDANEFQELQTEAAALNTFLRS